MKPYPLFIPPLHLAEKNRLAWSNAEANEYKRWLLAHIDERVQELVAYLHESRSETGRGLLRKLGRKTIHLLRNSSFAQSENGEVVLTNEGYALAADMGLLIAKLLIQESDGALTWRVVRSPKNDQSYNLPVLNGFSEVSYLDPIQVAVVAALKVAEGSADESAWIDVFERWREKIASHERERSRE